MEPNLELCKELVSKFAKTRAVNKRKITVIITKMKESKANNTLTKDNFAKQNTRISDMVKLIKLSDDEIVKLFEEHDVEELDPDFFAKEIDSQASIIIILIWIWQSFLHIMTDLVVIVTPLMYQI